MAHGVVKRGADDRDVRAAGPDVIGVGHPGQLHERRQADIRGEVEVVEFLVRAVPAVARSEVVVARTVGTLGHGDPPEAVALRAAGAGGVLAASARAPPVRDRRPAGRRAASYPGCETRARTLRPGDASHARCMVTGRPGSTVTSPTARSSCAGPALPFALTAAWASSARSRADRTADVASDAPGHVLRHPSRSRCPWTCRGGSLAEEPAESRAHRAVGRTVVSAGVPMQRARTAERTGEGTREEGSAGRATRPRGNRQALLMVTTATGGPAPASDA